MNFNSIILKWKTFLGDKRRSVLFWSFVFMFPVPNFYFIFMGVSTVWAFISLAFAVLFQGLFVFLIGTVLLLVHLIVFAYVMRLFVSVTDKALSLIDSAAIKNLIVGVAIAALFLVVCKYDIFFLADVGGGMQRKNFVEMLSGW